MNKQNQFICPVCGYEGLSSKPYENMPPITEELYTVIPPYGNYFGFPSYEVCSCCRFEYGNDDDPGTAEPDSFRDGLIAWLISENGNWAEPEKKPPGWSLIKQLNAAGIPIPFEVRRLAKEKKV